MDLVYNGRETPDRRPTEAGRPGTGRDLPYDAELKRRGRLVISEALETCRDDRDPADAEQRIAHHRRSVR